MALLDPPGRAPAVTEACERRLLGWELLLVLAVFPLQGVIDAVAALLATRLLSDWTPTRLAQIVPGHTAASFPLDLVQTLLGLLPAVLVAYLLARSGEGLAAIGLDFDRQRLRADLQRVTSLLLSIYLLPILLTNVLEAHAHLQEVHVDTQSPGDPLPMAYLAVALLAAITAGVVEEVTVLGYLVHRLEQRGVPGWAVVATAMLVRVSFHLYYGVGVIWVVAWSGVTVLLYRRWRRLAPFIAAHALWDAQAFGASFFPHVARGTTFVVALLVAMVLPRLIPRPTPARQLARDS
jgi:membrane protease YdiL (CAAX protease family)